VLAIASGLDAEPVQIERAGALGDEVGRSHVRFEVASAYELPFANASFNAVFAHYLVSNLHERPRAMRAAARASPGCAWLVCSIRTGASGSWSPRHHCSAFRGCSLARVEHCGSSPYYARHQRRMLLEAGFGRIEGYAPVGEHGPPERTRLAASNLEARLRVPAVWQSIVAEGWADFDTSGRCAPSSTVGPSGRMRFRSHCGASPSPGPTLGDGLGRLSNAGR